MPSPIPHDTVATAVLELFDETFSRVQGIYLDRGTSLFETLESISAEQASRSMGGEGSTIAAHVAHVIYYLEVLERYLLTHDAGAVDWGEVWRSVHAVDEAGWNALRERLRATSARIREQLAGFDDWGVPDRLTESLGIVIHSSHHLGEIRQALCWLRG